MAALAVLPAVAIKEFALRKLRRPPADAKRVSRTG